MQAVFSAYEVWNRRISTARINRWLEGVLSAHPPPAVAGRRIKIRYMTQAKARPPTFALFGNQLDHLPESYTRYLVNNLRETFDLPGTPIRLHTARRRKPLRQGAQGLMKVAVVGAGIAGLSTAWSLSKRGHEVTLFEQAPRIPNPYAASGDQHRIIRRAYGGADGYARTITEAFEAWDELWADLGRQHYAPCGVLGVSQTEERRGRGLSPGARPHRLAL